MKKLTYYREVSHYEIKRAKTNNHVEPCNNTIKKHVNNKTNLNIYESIKYSKVRN